jgi:hypothetical protein
VCVPQTPTLCPDGTPALWIGTTTSLIGFADIDFVICGTDAFFSGTFLCLTEVLPCFAVESPIFGTTVVSVDGIAIFFDPLIFPTGDSCTFNAGLIELTMGGDFTCVDPFGFILNTGTWTATRCP